MRDEEDRAGIVADLPDPVLAPLPETTVADKGAPVPSASNSDPEMMQVLFRENIGRAFRAMWMSLAWVREAMLVDSHQSA